MSGVIVLWRRLSVFQFRIVMSCRFLACVSGGAERSEWEGARRAGFRAWVVCDERPGLDLGGAGT